MSSNFLDEEDEAPDNSATSPTQVVGYLPKELKSKPGKKLQVEGYALPENGTLRSVEDATPLPAGDTKDIRHDARIRGALLQTEGAGGRFTLAGPGTQEVNPYDELKKQYVRPIEKPEAPAPVGEFYQKALGTIAKSTMVGPGERRAMTPAESQYVKEAEAGAQEGFATTVRNEPVRKGTSLFAGRPVGTDVVTTSNEPKSLSEAVLTPEWKQGARAAFGETGTKIAGGLAKGFLDFSEGMASPENVALIASIPGVAAAMGAKYGPAGEKMAHQLINGKFSVDMVKNLVTNRIPALVDAVKKGDIEAIAENLMAGAFDIGFTAANVQGALGVGTRSAQPAIDRAIERRKALDEKAAVVENPPKTPQEPVGEPQAGLSPKPAETPLEELQRKTQAIAPKAEPLEELQRATQAIGPEAAPLGGELALEELKRATQELGPPAAPVGLDELQLATQAIAPKRPEGAPMAFDIEEVPGAQPSLIAPESTLFPPTGRPNRFKRLQTVKPPKPRFTSLEEVPQEPAPEAPAPAESPVQPQTPPLEAQAPIPIAPERPGFGSRLKVHLGMNGARDVQFPDANHADLFSLSGRFKRQTRGQGGPKPDAEGVAARLGIDPRDVSRVAKEYRDSVMAAAKETAEGGVVTAPKFEEVTTPPPAAKVKAWAAEDKIKALEAEKGALFSKGEGREGELSLETARAAADTVAQELPGTNVKVHDSHEGMEITSERDRQIQREAIKNNADALYDDSTNTIHVFRNLLPDSVAVTQKVLHEAVHRGLSVATPEARREEITRQVGGSKVAKEFLETPVGREYVSESPAAQAEEPIARAAEKLMSGEARIPGTFKRVVSGLKEFARAIDPSVEYTEADILKIVNDALVPQLTERPAIVGAGGSRFSRNVKPMSDEEIANLEELVRREIEKKQSAPVEDLFREQQGITPTAEEPLRMSKRPDDAIRAWKEGTPEERRKIARRLPYGVEKFLKDQEAGKLGSPFTVRERVKAVSELSGVSPEALLFSKRAEPTPEEIEAAYQKAKPEEKRTIEEELRERQGITTPAEEPKPAMYSKRGTPEYEKALRAKNAADIIRRNLKIGKDVTNEEVGEFLEDFAEKHKGKADYADLDELKRRGYAMGLADAMDQLQRNPADAEFYRKDFDRAMTIAKNLNIGLDNPTKMAVFRTMIAGSSFGKNPTENSATAIGIWQLYRKTGRFPLKKADGTGWGGNPEFEVTAKKLNRILDMTGSEQGLVDWLNADHSIKELRSFSPSLGGKSSEMAPGWMIIGPKGGPFSLNLGGREEFLTIDRWQVRFGNRVMGNLLDKNGELINSPRGHGERDAHREFMGKVAEKLGLSVSQTQSLLWHFEKDLYTALGVPEERGSYGDAFESIARAAGREDAIPVQRAEEAGQGPAAVEPGQGGAGGEGADGVRFSKRPAGFYSEVEKAIDEYPVGGRLNPDQFLAWLRKRPGVKPTEIEWSNVERVAREVATKDELAAAIRESAPQTAVTETNYRNVPKDVSEAATQKYNLALEAETRSHNILNEAVDKAGLSRAAAANLLYMTRLGQMDHPVIKRALGIGLGREIADYRKAHEKVLDVQRELTDVTKEKPRFERYVLPGPYADYRETTLHMPNLEGEPYEVGAHFPGKNIVVHNRTTERTYADGKTGTNIEEIQSDMNQAGRKEGFRPRDLSEVSGITGIEDLPVPENPFQKSEDWALLGFKAALRDAVEKGHDRVTWTTGEQQAERYDLSKQVERVELNERTNGTKYLDVYDRNGNVLLNQRISSNAEIEKYIGKEPARRLLESGETDAETMGIPVVRKEISGENLKVGGEGMAGFYDKILPAVVNKYVKKWGGKVGEASINNAGGNGPTYPATEISPGKWVLDGDPRHMNETFPTREAALTALGKGNAVVHSVDITPAMRDSVKKGQPMYSKRAATPEDLERGKVKDLNDRSDWMVVEATDPGGKTASPEYNARATAELKRDLDRQGIQYEPIRGKYRDVDSEPNPGFLVFGDHDPAGWAKKYGHESILTNRGLEYQDGHITPSKGITEHETAPPNFYTEIPRTGAMFTSDLDFDTTRYRGLHAGPLKLDVVKPEFQGTGQMGAEKKRLANSEGQVPYSNWYTTASPVVENHRFGGKHVHEANLDVTNKPGGLIEWPVDKTPAQLKAEGYTGIFFPKEKQAHVFVDMPVEYRGKAATGGKPMITGAEYMKGVKFAKRAPIPEELLPDVADATLDVDPRNRKAWEKNAISKFGARIKPHLEQVHAEAMKRYPEMEGAGIDTFVDTAVRMADAGVGTGRGLTPIGEGEISKPVDQLMGQPPVQHRSDVAADALAFRSDPAKRAELIAKASDPEFDGKLDQVAQVALQQEISEAWKHSTDNPEMKRKVALMVRSYRLGRTWLARQLGTGGANMENLTPVEAFRFGLAELLYGGEGEAAPRFAEEGAAAAERLKGVKFSKRDEKFMSWRPAAQKSIRDLTPDEARNIIERIHAEGPTIEHPDIRELTGGYASQTINNEVVRMLGIKAGIIKTKFSKLVPEPKKDTLAPEVQNEMAKVGAAILEAGHTSKAEFREEVLKQLGPRAEKYLMTIRAGAEALYERPKPEPKVADLTQRAQKLMIALEKEGFKNLSGMSDAEVVNFMSDRKEFQRFVTVLSTLKAGRYAKATELYRNGLLSAISTFWRNGISNAVHLAMEYGATKPASAIATTVLRGGRGRGVQDLGPAYKEFILAGGDAFKNAWEALRGEYDIDYTGTLRNDPIRQLHDILTGQGRGPAIAGAKGRFVRLPQRIQGAVDVLFGTFAANIEAFANAHEMARREGLTGAERKARVDELFKNKESEAWLKAQKEASRLMFREELDPLAKVGMGIRSAIPAGEWFMPFWSTPYNIGKVGAKMTPLGYAITILERRGRGRTWKQAVHDRWETEDLVRPLMAPVIAAAAYGLVNAFIAKDDEKGSITPMERYDQRHSAEWNIKQGARPQGTIETSRGRTSYERVEPLSDLLSAAAAYKEAKKAGKDTMPALIKASMNYLDQTTTIDAMKSLVEVITLLQDKKPEDALHVLQRNLASIVPFSSLRRAISGINEQNVSENRIWGATKPGDVGETKLSRSWRRTARAVAPELTERPPAKITPAGEEMPRAGGGIEKFLTPFKTIAFEKGPGTQILRNIIDYNEREAGKPFWPGKVDPYWTEGGARHSMTDQQRHDFEQKIGRMWVEMIMNEAPEIAEPGHKITEEETKLLGTLRRKAGTEVRKSLLE